MSKRKIIAAVAGLVACVLLGASVYVQQAQRELSLTLQIRIAEQAQTLSTISELTHQNKADALAASILRDCSNDSRVRYETLLNQLATLPASDLQELEQLFEACGGFFAEQKAVMVARLNRELEVYTDYVQLLETIDNTTPLIDSRLMQWQQLVALESERSELMSEQVEVQRIIIDVLQAADIRNDEVESQLVRAQQITQRVTTINTEIESLRATLQNV